MGQGISTPIKENLDAIHTKLMKHGGAEYDIATSTTLTYELFISYISRVNEICYAFKDDENNVLIFAIKKGTDSSIFWRATTRIACVKFNLLSKTVESHKLLNLRQFLQAFRDISYECTESDAGLAAVNDTNSGDSAMPTSEAQVPPTSAASNVLANEATGGIEKRDVASEVVDALEKCSGSSSAMGVNVDTTVTGASNASKADNDTTLDECIICLERKPDVILPCSHAYCVPCIEQWWEYAPHQHKDRDCLPYCFRDDESTKNCPICRESIDDADDAWVLPEVPNESEVSKEIRKSLLRFASN